MDPSPSNGQPDDDLDLSEPAPTVCDSCGSDDEHLVRVRRIYLDPAAEGPSGERVLDEDEWWCLPCRTHYPHQLRAG